MLISIKTYSSIAPFSQAWFKNKVQAINQAVNGVLLLYDWVVFHARKHQVTSGLIIHTVGRMEIVGSLHALFLSEVFTATISGAPSYKPLLFKSQLLYFHRLHSISREFFMEYAFKLILLDYTLILPSLLGLGLLKGKAIDLYLAHNSPQSAYHLLYLNKDT